MKPFVATVLTALLLATVACGGSKVAGTYSNANGSMVLTLKSDGTGSMSLLGESKPCTYTTAQAQIKVQCDTDEFDFNMQDDGSLTGPPDSLMGPLKKTS